MVKKTVKKPRKKATPRAKIEIVETPKAVAPVKKFMERGEIDNCTRLNWGRTTSRLELTISEQSLRNETLEIALLKATRSGELARNIQAINTKIKNEPNLKEALQKDLLIAQLLFENFNKDLMYREKVTIPSLTNMRNSLDKVYTSRCNEVNALIERLAAKYNMPIQDFAYNPHTGEIIER